MKIERKWAMPNAWTFTILPIKKLLDEEYTDGSWCDPFAGKMSFHNSMYSNDLSPDSPARYHEDALTFLKSMETGFFDGVLFDPPYSITQAKQHYGGRGMEKLDTKPTSMKYWGDCKTEIARITKKGGKVICFGWNTMGIGKSRGFRMDRILIVPHGGSKNDTLVTVEKKLPTPSKEVN